MKEFKVRDKRLEELAAKGKSCKSSRNDKELKHLECLINYNRKKNKEVKSQCRNKKGVGPFFIFMEF